MTNGRRLPAIAPGIEIADFDVEIVALIPDRRRAVHLEAGHAIVLDSCRRGDELDHVASEIARATGLDPADAAVWVDSVVQELARLGVVVPSGVSDEASPAEDARDRPL